MNKFKTTIGLEIHLELNTKTKLFSPSKINFNSIPNSLVHPIDLGYPGTLPSLNRQAVIKAIKLAKALNMTISDYLIFDRKHYFYPDLPKGYQITQYHNPIAKNGYLKLENNKIIRIKQIHIEEDTAKSIHKDNKWYLDFNRAGIPLIEIVSEPDFENSDQVIEYVDLIRLTSLYLDISDAKMENGSLRVDLNISNTFINEKILGQKVEIKNLNSLNNLALAIDKEIKIQTTNLLNGEKILQVTKKFDDQSKELKIMRQKDQILDYKYLPEFDIPPIKISDSLLKEAQINELPWTKKEKYLSQNISNEHTRQLIRSIDKMEFFDSLTYFDKNKASNIFFKEIVSFANKNNCLIKKLNIKPSDFDELLKINFPSSLYKQIIPFLVNNKLSISELLEKHNLKVINDEIELKKIVSKIWNANLNYITNNIKNEKRIRKLLIGQVMAETKGLANPEIINKIITFMIKGIINT